MRSAAEGAPSWVHVPGLAGAAGEIAIGGEEAHYLRRVVRVRVGETVTATDGEGTVAELAVVGTEGDVRALVRERRSVPRGPVVEIWCGAPEGDRADWLVEKLGELGVASLRLLDTERGSWERVARRTERWGRLAVAALRQSRAAWRLSVHPPVALATALAGAGFAGCSYLAEPTGSPFGTVVGAGPGPVRAAVGPSGGFSSAERNQLEDNGFVPTRLTAGRLRTETAAVAMAALALTAGERARPVAAAGPERRGP